MRALGWALERIRRRALQELGAFFDCYRLMDITPVPVMKLCRFGHTSLFPGEATVGYCSSKKEFYVGFKLALLTTLEGVSTHFDLVPAHTDDREAMEGILEASWRLVVLGDKGGSSGRGGKRTGGSGETISSSPPNVATKRSRTLRSWSGCSGGLGSSWRQ